MGCGPEQPGSIICAMSTGSHSAAMPGDLLGGAPHPSTPSSLHFGNIPRDRCEDPGQMAWVTDEARSALYVRLQELVLFLGSASWKLWFSIFTSCSTFWGIGLHCDIIALVCLRRVVDFQFVRDFSCYEDESNQFQAPYFLGRKIYLFI